MLPFPIDGRALIVIALVVVSLLLMIFAPQAMANLLGEPFSLIGRLVGTIADWLQKGADKLFALVKSVFLIGHPVEKRSIAADLAPASPSQTSASTSTYQARILEHPASETTVGPSDQPAPDEPETAPSITPYPNHNDSSSYYGSYSGAPSQQGDRVYGDRVYGDPSYNGYPTNGTNGNGSSSRAVQSAAPNGVAANGTYTGVPSVRATGSVSAPTEPAKSEEPEIHATWVGEVIISHVLYLVAGVIIVVSDFVFTVLRLQAVLFPDLPINPELANLSDLSGALFVSMVFLTGALTLDFLGVLPPPARLFPTMDDKKRRMFLALSLGAFLLNMAVVGILFFAGQTLISYAVHLAARLAHHRDTDRRVAGAGDVPGGLGRDPWLERPPRAFPWPGGHRVRIRCHDPHLDSRGVTHRRRAPGA